MRIGISLPVRELKDDIEAITAFAQTADELGFTHLRVPDQVIRPRSGHLHEPMTLLAFIAAVTQRVELVPSVIVLPSRQTALVAKQAAEIDVLSKGRLRMAVGVGGSREEYAAMGEDFATRGTRCEEQIALLKRLWTKEEITMETTSGRLDGIGIDPLPVQRPIPLWIGANPRPGPRILRRIGKLADGWFVLCDPERYPGIRDEIHTHARRAGRDPNEIGAEAGVAVVGPREAEWQDRVAGWRRAGLTHLCIRTLGGELEAKGHLTTMRRAAETLEASGTPLLPAVS
jgi:probable F420-dependent oxidoreductase